MNPRLGKVILVDDVVQYIGGDKMRKDGAFIKAERVSQIGKLIAKSSKNGECNLNVILNIIQTDIGLRYSTAEEYVKLICNRKGWYIDEQRKLIILSAESESKEE